MVTLILFSDHFPASDKQRKKTCFVPTMQLPAKEKHRNKFKEFACLVLTSFISNHHPA
jgi:hypothetical protein